LPERGRRTDYAVRPGIEEKAGGKKEMEVPNFLKE